MSKRTANPFQFSTPVTQPNEQLTHRSSHKKDQETRAFFRRGSILRLTLTGDILHGEQSRRSPTAAPTPKEQQRSILTFESERSDGSGDWNRDGNRSRRRGREVRRWSRHVNLARAKCRDSREEMEVVGAISALPISLLFPQFVC